MKIEFGGAVDLNLNVNLNWNPQLDMILGVLQNIMSAFDDIKALITGIATDVAEIEGDLDEVIAKLPAEGSLDAAQVAEIRTMLTGTKTKTREVADKVPEPPTA